MSPDICPVCGADVPPNAKACPGCGADDKTGWSEKARYDELGIPDDEEKFDYDDFVKREFDGKKPKQKMELIWVIVAILLVVSLLAYFF